MVLEMFFKVLSNDKSVETLDPQDRATRVTGRDPLDDATYQMNRDMWFPTLWRFDK